jgi:hypothetical protein
MHNDQAVMKSRILFKVGAIFFLLLLLFACDLTGIIGGGTPPGKDVAAPSVTGTTPTNDKKPIWSWTVTQDTSAVAYQLDTSSGAWTTVQPIVMSFSPSYDLTDGNHTLYVKAQNGSGFWSKNAQFTILVDTVPPNPPVVSAEVSADAARPQWSWVGSTGTVGFRYQLDAEASDAWTEVGAVTKIFQPAENLSLAVHTLYVQAADSAGNWSVSGSFAVNLDPDAPELGGTTPTSLTTPTWTWTIASEAQAVAFTYQLDGGPDWVEVGAGVRSFTPSNPLSEGSHTLTLKAKDQNGAWSSGVSFTIVIDETPPSSPAFSGGAGSTTERRPVWSWTGSADTVRYRYQLDGENQGAWIEVDSQTRQYQPLNDLSFATHILYVQAADCVGNWSASGSCAKTIIPSAPVVSGVGYTTSKTPTWNWTIPEGAVGIAYQLDSTSGEWTAVLTSVLSYTYSGSPILLDGGHTLYVRAQVASVWSAVSQWTTVIDTVPPDAPVVLGTTPTGEKRPLWKWSPPDDATSGIGMYRYQLDSILGLWIEVPATTTEYRLPFVMEGPHTLYVQAADKAGNWSTSGSLLIDPIWHNQTLDSNSSTAAQDVAVSINSVGNPGMCYADSATSSLFLIQWNGSAWQKQTLDSGGAGSFVSFSYDRKGFKNIAYTDPSGFSLKCIYYDLYSYSEDVREVVETSASARITRVRLATDWGPRPRIIYTREGAITRFVVNQQAGMTFFDPTGTGGEWTPSISSDNSGATRLMTFTSTDIRQRVWNPTNGGWQSATTIAWISASSSCCSAVAVDGPLNGAVRQLIAYSTSASEVWYIKENASGWDSPQRVRTGSSSQVGTVGIAFDSKNSRPVIVYTIGSDLYCALLNGGIWQEELVDSGVAKCVSMTVDSMGVVHIAYYDGASGHLKYAKRD